MTRVGAEDEIARSPAARAGRGRLESTIGSTRGEAGAFGFPSPSYSQSYSQIERLTDRRESTIESTRGDRDAFSPLRRTPNRTPGSKDERTEGRVRVRVRRGRDARDAPSPSYSQPYSRVERRTDRGESTSESTTGKGRAGRTLSVVLPIVLPGRKTDGPTDWGVRERSSPLRVRCSSVRCSAFRIPHSAFERRCCQRSNLPAMGCNCISQT